MNQDYFKNLLKSFTQKGQEHVSLPPVYKNGNIVDDDNTPDVLEQYENMLREVNGLLPKLEGYFDSRKNTAKNIIKNKKESASCVKKSRSTQKSRKNKVLNPLLNPKVGNKTSSEFPFIKITSVDNGVVEDILLTKEEIKILKTASRDNYGIINLLSKKDSIMSLFNKGVISILDNESARMGIKEELIHIFNHDSSDGIYTIESKMVEWGGIVF